MGPICARAGVTISARPKIDINNLFVFISISVGLPPKARASGPEAGSGVEAAQWNKSAIAGPPGAIWWRFTFSHFWLCRFRNRVSLRVTEKVEKTTNWQLDFGPIPICASHAVELREGELNMISLVPLGLGELRRQSQSDNDSSKSA
jgi:hypothetical protein